ncbi:hypothetical protein SUGI_1069490 [Cryptomeria japonica]|nr:hypothetical protein SUGI_1069490 [Cryptomeria japonica]
MYVSVIILVADMVHHTGLSCMCRDETFQVQCKRLFHTGEGVFDAMWRLASSILGGGRNWCDGFIYEAIANEILNLESKKWESLLGVYFNTANYISSDSDEDSNYENEGDVCEKEEKGRKKAFIEDAWEVCRIGFINRNLALFQRLMDTKDCWLSVASAMKIMEIGEWLAIILQSLLN